MLWGRKKSEEDADTILRREAEKFAKGLAKAQVKAFKNMFLGLKFTGDSREDDWREVLLTRPGYNADMVDDIISSTRATCLEHDSPYNFQAVVIHLAAYEFQSRTGLPSDEYVNELATGVCSVLSSNIGGDPVPLV